VNRSLARAAPIRFLIGVAALWMMARGVALTGWEPAPARPPTPGRFALHPPTRPRPRPPLPVPQRHGKTEPRPLSAPDRPETTAPRAHARLPFTPTLAAYPSSPGPAAEPRASTPMGSGPSSLSEAVIAPGPPSTKRWSGSAWMFLRGGGRATTLSPGQVGGGQAGVRILYRLAPRLSAAARFSTAIGGIRQSEASAGLDWAPIARLPVHLMAERRVAIDAGGRNAWTLGMAGGIDDVRIAPGWRLDAYGEAGVVGARRRDLYADGAARIARAIGVGAGRTLALGGGLWAAAQPDATRLDIGPSAVLRLPVAHRTVAIALDWHERVAGHARPGSGVALTVATDF
jgi:hypothetical protein